MLAHQKRSQIVGPLVLVGALLAFGLSVLFLDTRPEFISVSAPDEGLRVVGEVPHSVDVRVVKDLAASDQAWTAVDGSVYAVSPDGVLLPAHVTIQMPTLGRAGDYAIGWFDPSRSLWLPQETQRDDVRGVFETRTDHFSHWALLRHADVAVPERVREGLIEEAIAERPEGTIGYRVDLAYATVDGDFVLLESLVAQGRCESPSVRADREEKYTVVDERLSIDVDTTETDVWLRTFVTWQTGTGCATIEPLQ